VLFREQESWRKAALMVMAAITLPFVSGDYTTPLMYFPLVLFLNAPRVTRHDAVYAVLFGLLLVPVDYRYLRGFATIDTSVSIFVYPAVLVALTVLILRDSAPVTVVAGEGRGLRERLSRLAL